MRLNHWNQACAVVALLVAMALALRAQTFTTLLSFDMSNGFRPDGALVQGTDGGLYGTTPNGGAHGAGNVFRVTPSGVTTVYSFCAQGTYPDCPDGSLPEGGLIQAVNGNFYGTTTYGGANGAGSIFALSPSGALTTIYSFCVPSACGDGDWPIAGLIQASSGELYGTTQYGGTPPIGNGGGTIFKVTPSGMFTTLYSFCVGGFPCADGQEPVAPLIQANNGDFYGPAGGTIFKITPAGTLTTLANGIGVVGPLVQGTDGNFYGTGFDEGVTNSNGAVFKITPGGTVTTLYSFCLQDGCPDGASPSGGLVQATDGNFYGTTENGGTNGSNRGTIFKITPSGALTTLYSFCSQSKCTDGAGPYGPLVQATDGLLYGTTGSGGAKSYGVAFSVSLGLSPFVKTQPTSAHVGTAVKILGTDLGGASSVTFNGTPAVFKVVSKSLISTTVPAGASTGTVQVVIPSGTLSSNLPFQVR